MATLDALTNIRSQRALRLEAHLRWVASGGPWPTPPWLRRAHRTIWDVYQLPDVEPWDSATMDVDAGMADEVRRPRRWKTVWPRIRRAVVVGRPGEGKSTLLQWTARQVALESLRLWESRSLPLEKIPVPILVKADRIMQAGSLEEAIRLATTPRRSASTSKRAQQPRRVTAETDGLSCRELLEAVKSDTAWLFVDALDERPGLHAASSDLVRQALDSLQYAKARLLISVRSERWDPSLLSFPVGSPSNRRRATRPNGSSSTPVPSARSTAVVYHLSKLSPYQREAVVSAWHPGKAGATERRKLTALLDVVPMAELTSNALLLTLLCSAARVKGREISAGTRRAQLYDWLVRDFVAREDSEFVGLDPSSEEVQVLAEALAVAAWKLWKLLFDSGAAMSDASVSSDERPELGFTPSQWNNDAGPKVRRLRPQLEAAGLLLNDGDRLTFFPQTLFEYLAGAGLVLRAAAGGARVDDRVVRDVVLEIVAHGSHPHWQELFKLGIGFLVVLQRRRDVASAIVEQVVADMVHQPEATRGAVAALLAEAFLECGERDERLPPNLTGGPAEGERVLQPSARASLVAVLQRTMESAAEPDTAAHVPATIRVRAGDALGWIGDPRFDPDAFYLPMATKKDPYRGLRLIPDGTVLMGSDREDPLARPDEVNAEIAVVHQLLMARWLVTVAQFAAYLEDSAEIVGDPACLADPPTAPVRFVNWFEATRYCEWLTQQLSKGGPLEAFGRAVATALKAQHPSEVTVRLPTEMEWEYVAKGGDEGRRFPWGPAFDTDRANSLESRVSTTSAVGSFRRGESRWRVELAGNLNQWGHSRYQLRGYPIEYPFDDFGARCRVMRGGSFHNYNDNLRSARRDNLDQECRNPTVGFRVVVSANRPWYE